MSLPLKIFGTEIHLGDPKAHDKDHDEYKTVDKTRMTKENT